MHRYGNAQAQVQYSQNNPRWVLPAFFHHTSYTFGGGLRVGLIFVDTNLMNYG
jgi:hypothetical protein